MSDSKFAVIKTGGKQYKVEKGSKIKIEKLHKKEGSEVVFKDVFLYIDDKTVEVGTPKVSSVEVVGRVLAHGKADKVIVYKYKKRKRERKKKGHRQHFTQVEILDIKKGSSRAKAPASKVSRASTKTPSASKKEVKRKV